jgi:hypothetical protein
VIGAPSRLRLIRNTAAFARTLPHFDFSIDVDQPPSRDPDLPLTLFLFCPPLMDLHPRQLRGVCAGCGQGVYSDQPRSNPSGKYYHAECDAGYICDLLFAFTLCVITSCLKKYFGCHADRNSFLYYHSKLVYPLTVGCVVNRRYVSGMTLLGWEVISEGIL